MVAELMVLRQDTNPRQPLIELSLQRDALLELPLALPGQTADMRQTLQKQNLK